jgi:hypothetical protein
LPAESNCADGSSSQRAATNEVIRRRNLAARLQAIDFEQNAALIAMITNTAVTSMAPEMSPLSLSCEWAAFVLAGLYI